MIYEYATHIQITYTRFESAAYIGLMNKYRPTFLHIVPPIVSFLASHPNVTPETLSSLRQANMIVFVK